MFKMALSISTTRELTSLLKWMESLESRTPFVVLGMEDLGQPSRLLGAFLGNFWTYVAEDEDSKVAAAYWRAEALSRVDTSTEAITYFQAVADAYAGHHLATAALNRADRLRVHFDIISGAAD